MTLGPSLFEARRVSRLAPLGDGTKFVPGKAQAAFPKNSLSAATTRRLASSVPMLMRRALGR